MNTNIISPLLLYFLIVFLIPCNGRSFSFSNNAKIDEGSNSSLSSESVFSCGDSLNIHCPLTFEGHRVDCWNQSTRGQVSCENNRTVMMYASKKFYVTDIDYEKKGVRLVDPGLDKDNCSALPQHTISGVPLFEDFAGYKLFFLLEADIKAVVYLKCSDNQSASHRYVDASPCFKTSSNMSTYVIIDPMVSEVKRTCKSFLTAQMSSDKDTFGSYSDVHREMMKGFWVNWMNMAYRSGPPAPPAPGYIPPSSRERFWHEVKYFFNYNATTIRFSIGMLFLGRFVLGTICVLPFFILMIRRRNRAMNGGIEDFLNKYGDQMPMRYSYSDVKRMTSNFKEKLGEGGFGSVYKGSLRSNRAVAIKILSSTNGKGRDFVNEVATIGRIHHVNVVSLIGFVAERSKRALVYELMPNGSLEKYLFPLEEGKRNNLLSWERTYEIALGIARGIEYLHRGCDMRILHFDIKPHNILLDQNYNPKVSDFGLAKLCSMDDSIVAVTKARGTRGYMAPELFYKNLGGVSYKSDVYSFGMLLMEMAGRRKNMNPLADNPSQIHFPTWIYGRLKQGDDIKMEDATQEDNEIAKKIIIVALWCIQLKPIDRPSMTKAVEMLEGDLGQLEIPQKPLSITECGEQENVMLNSVA